ncbi:hypothetical protein NC651_010160 [Populus alba x Populus x berolinensis]|nr:hypothetical protein NC651_010160 [Populus alba x Populus x berolinensis]
MLKIALLKCLHMFQIWFLVPKVFTSFCVVIYQARALPAPSSEPSTPASIGSQEVQRPPRNAASPSSQQEWLSLLAASGFLKVSIQKKKQVIERVG